MSRKCGQCPAPTELPSIPDVNCPFNIKQLQKFGIQNEGQKFVAGTNDIKLIASWTPRLSATDLTKIVITPFVSGNPTITAGDVITEGGGDNSTLGGQEVITGVNPPVFTAEFNSLTPDQESAFKAYMCLKNLEVIFFNEEGKIICRKDKDGNHVGFPISSFFFSDRDNQGFSKLDKFTCRFSLKADYSSDLVMIEPDDFNALVELKNP